jgi:hypothetical protein
MNLHGRENPVPYGVTALYSVNTIWVEVRLCCEMSRGKNVCREMGYSESDFLSCIP